MIGQQTQVSCLSGTGDDKSIQPCIQLYPDNQQQEIISIAKSLAMNNTDQR